MNEKTICWSKTLVFMLLFFVTIHLQVLVVCGQLDLTADNQEVRKLDFDS